MLPAAAAARISDTARHGFLVTGGHPYDRIFDYQVWHALNLRKEEFAQVSRQQWQLCVPRKFRDSRCG